MRRGKTFKTMQHKIISLLLSLIVIFAPSYVIVAQQSSSTNYSVNELIFGAGGSADPTSSNYSILATIGETAVGNLSSTNYQAFGGFQTTDVPFLELIVTASNIDLGVLSSGSTATANGYFSVRTYLASGYSVTSVGLPTSESNQTIAPMAATAASSAGTEQFGINLVENTDPASFGVDPVQVPGDTFSFGAASANYATPDVYRYNELEEIAYSNSSSGQTDFTISYIYNISSVTEAGLYTLNHSIIATSTY